MSENPLDGSAEAGAPSGDALGIGHPVDFVVGAGTDAVDAPADARDTARPRWRRATRIGGIAAVVALVVGGGVFAAVKLITSGTGAGCLIGSWRMTKFPAELASTGAEMLDGQLALTFTSDGNGTQTLTDVHVKPVSGPSTTVHGLLTYHYSASDSQITYTAVGGYIVISFINVQLSEPQTSITPDTYSCSGDRLTVNTASANPEVFNRS